jgi:general stress protein 26
MAWTPHRSTAMSERTRCYEKLGELIGDVEIAMLTTVRADGRLVSRPLRTIARTGPFGGELWFFVHAGSNKVHDIEHDAHVNLAYAAPGRNTFVSVSGRARIVENQAKIDELWSPELALFFAGGRDERDLVLLRVDIDGAEYWDGPSTFIGQALDIAGALVTGEASPLSERGAIDVRRGH